MLYLLSFYGIPQLSLAPQRVAFIITARALFLMCYEFLNNLKRNHLLTSAHSHPPLVCFSLNIFILALFKGIWQYIFIFAYRQELLK